MSAAAADSYNVLHTGKYTCYTDTVTAPTIPLAACFDLDNTLAESNTPPSTEMIDRLIRLTRHIPIAIITARTFDAASQGFLPILTRAHTDAKLFVMPESGALCFAWDRYQWIEQYGIELPEHERMIIRRAVGASVRTTHALDTVPCTGTQWKEKRGQITFVCTGVDASREVGQLWDTDGSRRRLLYTDIVKQLPLYQVLIGGSTSIDISHAGIDKSYAVRWLAQELHITPHQMYFVGDALYPGGNDSVVIKTGIVTRSTSGPEETEHIIDELLAAF